MGIIVLPYPSHQYNQAGNRTNDQCIDHNLYNGPKCLSDRVVSFCSSMGNRRCTQACFVTVYTTGKSPPDGFCKHNAGSASECSSRVESFCKYQSQYFRYHIDIYQNDDSTRNNIEESHEWNQV